MGSPSPFSFYQHSDHVLIEETDTGAENLSPSASTSQQPTCQFVPNLSDTANQYHRTAIYANSTSNFTTLAIVGNLPGNEYFDYMYAPYAKIKDWGNDDHVIVDDDDEDLPDETWLEKASVLASQWKKDFASWSCRRRWPVLMRRTMQRQFCFAEWEYPPQGPRSRYRHLLSQSRMNRLRNLMPKWFRSLKSKQMTKSKLIMYLVEYLEQIKQISLAEHGIKITSAIISRPSWMYSKYDDIFDEACLLAGIEVVEQPHSRVDMATKALSTDEGPVMVLDHGHYYLNIHRSTWDEYNKQYRQRGSMNLDYYGTTWVLKQLANRILWDYNRNATVEERGWSRTVENQVVVMQTLGARLQIKYRRDWPEDLEFEKRTVGVNLTDSTGFLRVLNMTGEDVRRVDKEYVEEISDVMLTGLWKHKEIHQYMRSKLFPPLFLDLRLTYGNRPA